MINRKTRYPVALDIGNRVIHAAQFRRAGVQPEVSGLYRVELREPERPGINDELLSVLRKIFKSKMFRGRRVAAHMPAQHFLVFPVRFQVAKTESIESALVREVGETLPFPVAEAIIDYPCLSRLPMENTYKALVTAVRREHVENFLKLLRQAGGDIDVVDFRTSSLIRLHYSLFKTSENPVILCYIGFSKSVLSVVSKHHIPAHRMFRWGIDSIADKVISNLEFIGSRKNAGELLSKYGLNRENEKSYDTTHSVSSIERVVSQLVTPCIEELVYEFHTITAYVRHEEENARFDSIYLYGQAPGIKGLDCYLKKTMGLPVKTINPLRHIPVSSKISLSGEWDRTGTFAPALGLAMRCVSWL